MKCKQPSDPVDKPAKKWIKTGHLRDGGRAKAKVSLKTINIVVEEEHEDEVHEDTLWFDLEEFDCHDGNAAAKHQAPSRADIKMDVDEHREEEDRFDAMSTQSDLSSYGIFGGLGNSRLDLVNSVLQRRQPKRIIWGEEVPLAVDSNQTNGNYVMTMGVNGANPLITIRPVGHGGATESGGPAGALKEDIVITASTASSMVQSHRVLEMDKLRNYFQLTEPDTGASESGNTNKSQYFLSLLDPSMPRLTNCGYYYRMRYAVYVLPKRTTSRSMMSTTNWRKRTGSKQITKQHNDGANKSGTTLLHIGEMHLYTIFPKDGGKFRNPCRDWLPAWCLERNNFIYYENISFFVNQTALSAEDMNALQVTESDINQVIVPNFRRYLKQLHSTFVNVNTTSANPDQANYNSTYLLEQLKYPKSSEHFTNPDRICEQFVRNQMDMFARYHAHFSGQLKLEEDELEDLSARSSSKTSGRTDASDRDTSKDVVLTGESFVAKLHRLRNQAERNLFEA